MVRDATGDPGTWEVARELGKQLIIPVGPYEARVPTADEFNAVLPYIMDRAARFYERHYFCENAEVTLAHILGMNVPRQGFPRSDGLSRHNVDWNGFNADGYDRDGYNRDGFGPRGYNRDGFDKDGYNYDGFDKEGYNKQNQDMWGRTRDQAITKQVNDWSAEFAAAIAAHLDQLPAAQAPKKAAAKKAPAKAAAKKAAPAEKVPVKAAKKAAPKKVAAKKAIPRNPLDRVAPRRRDHVAVG